MSKQRYILDNQLIDRWLSLHSSSTNFVLNGIEDVEFYQPSRWPGCAWVEIRALPHDLERVRNQRCGGNSWVRLAETSLLVRGVSKKVKIDHTTSFGSWTRWSWGVDPETGYNSLLSAWRRSHCCRGCIRTLHHDFVLHAFNDQIVAPNWCLQALRFDGERQNDNERISL
jgi:hypothetical protein